MRHFYFALIILFMSLCLTACKKQFTGLSMHANEIFWVTNNGADMPVRVMGNTSSKVIILITERLREKYAVAFWDQRNSGASAGNNNLSNLSLPQMINDLEVVVKVLKLRYDGADIFLCAHSFGGLLSAGYLVKDSNQIAVKGWIDIDGAHDYPLTNTLSRKMLIDTAQSEIDKNHYALEWQSILDYCGGHDPLSSYKVSSQIETYAHRAEYYMGIQQNSSLSLAEDPFDELANYYNLNYSSTGIDFLESLESISYSDQLYKIKIPTLLLWGQFDFVVPPSVGETAIASLGSAYKKMVLCPHSGHHPMETDTDLVEDEIINFIENFK
jgi:pimeloyl-ACP methyl ester carboxylesterase